MFNQTTKVMLYVVDQEKAIEFWTKKVGFELVETVIVDPEKDVKSYEIKPKNQNHFSLVLQNKLWVEENYPQVVNNPSLLFNTDDLNKTYEMLQNNGVHVGPINVPFEGTFNFCDDEDNYFGAQEIK